MPQEERLRRPPPEAARPAVPLALAVLAGTALAQAWPSGPTLAPAAPVLAVAAALLFVAAAHAGSKGRRARRARGRGPAPARAVALVLVGTLALGAARGLDARAEREAPAPLDLAPGPGVPAMVKGEIAGRALVLAGGRAEVPLRVESWVRDDRNVAPGGFVVRARIPAGERRRAGDLLPGRRLEVEGRLARPAPASGTAALLEREGEAAVLEATSVWRLGRGSTLGAEALAARLARRVGQALVAADLDREPEAVLRAILLGDRGRLPPDLRRAFAATGTIHLLVVGGLHVALLAGLGARAARALPLPDLARRGLVLAPVLAYVAVAGARPGTLRAAIAAGLVVALGPSGRAGDAWNRLAVAAGALLLWDPQEVGLAGFQLSFGTVAGILALGGLASAARAPGRARPPGRRGGLRRLAARGLHEGRGAWAAFVAHAPFALAWFGQLAPAGALANLVAIPLALVALAPGAVGAVLGALAPALGRPFLRLAGLAASALVGVVRGFAALPLATIEVPPPAPLATATAVGLAALGISLVARGDRPRRGVLLASTGALLWLGAVLPRGPALPAATSGLAPTRLLVRPAKDGARVELVVGDARPVRLGSPTAASPTAASPTAAPGLAVRVEPLGEDPDRPVALRIETDAGAALVALDPSAARLARLLATEPDARLRASVLVCPARASRALVDLVARARPSVLLVPARHPGSAAARRLVAAGHAPLELARTGPLEVELGPRLSVRPLR